MGDQEPYVPPPATGPPIADHSRSTTTMRIARYCFIVTMIALASAILLVILLDGGLGKIQEWIVEVIVIPLIVAPPFAVLGMKRKIEVEKLNVRLQHALDHDQLTRTNTRQSLINHFEVAKGQRVLVMVDADHFKRINDQFGHLIGDQALCHLADAMRAHTRERDLVSRFGGEEFVIMLSDVTMDQAVEICERVRAHLNATPVVIPSGEITVTVSMGLTLCLDGEPIDAALARADAAVYRAKELGRNRIQIAEPAPVMAAE